MDGSGAAFTGKVYLKDGTYKYVIGGAGKGTVIDGGANSGAGGDSSFELIRESEEDDQFIIRVTGGQRGGARSLIEPNIGRGGQATVIVEGVTPNGQPLVNGQSLNGKDGSTRRDGSWYIGIGGAAPITSGDGAGRGAGGSKTPDEELDWTDLGAGGDRGIGGYIKLTYSNKDN